MQRWGLPPWRAGEGQRQWRGIARLLICGPRTSGRAGQPAPQLPAAPIRRARREKRARCAPPRPRSHCGPSLRHARQSPREENRGIRPGREHERIRSMARAWPMRRGRRTVQPSIRGTPQRRQKTPSVAFSSTTRRSHHRASSNPPAEPDAQLRARSGPLAPDAPATACPATAAMTGLDRSMRVGPMGPSPSASRRFIRAPPPATAWRSAPEQNVPWSPQRTAHWNVASVPGAFFQKHGGWGAGAARPPWLPRHGRTRGTRLHSPHHPGQCENLQ